MCFLRFPLTLIKGLIVLFTYPRPGVFQGFTIETSIRSAFRDYGGEEGLSLNLRNGIGNGHGAETQPKLDKGAGIGFAVKCINLQGIINALS